MINTTVIGAGFIGKVHLETLMKLPGVNVKAIADTNLKMAEDLSESYGIDKVTDDYHDLLYDPEIQVFHNCTPNFLHYTINKDILEAGKHLLSEKPLSTDAEQARTLTYLADKKDLVTGVNFCYRYYPVVQEASARVKSGEIGKVYSVMGNFLQDWLLYDTDYNWRLNKNKVGDSNAMADIGSHLFDLAQFVTGSKIVEVISDLRTLIPVRKRNKTEVLTFNKQQKAGKSAYDEIPIDVEDYGSVLVRFDNGASGTFTVSQLSAGRKDSVDIQVYGSRSALSWNHEKPMELWCGNRDGANQMFMENPLLQKESTSRYNLLPAGHPMGFNDAVFNLFNDFYKAVYLKENNKKINFDWPNFQTGYEEMRIIDAILKSSRQKKWVNVEL